MLPSNPVDECSILIYLYKLFSNMSFCFVKREKKATFFNVLPTLTDKCHVESMRYWPWAVIITFITSQYLSIMESMTIC